MRVDFQVAVLLFPNLNTALRSVGWSRKFTQCLLALTSSDTRRYIGLFCTLFRSYMVDLATMHSLRHHPTYRVQEDITYAY